MTSPNDWTVLRMLEWATDYFREKEVPSPRLSIEWLLAHVLSVGRLDLYLRYDRPLASSELQTLRTLVRRRARHEPLQYITGSTAFYNAEIHVGPSVLIPRPETEELVELILNDHPQPGLKLVDLGTGSGCIPIACKMERPGWDVTGVDISADALDVARQNAQSNHAGVSFIQGDLSDDTLLPGRQWDIVVSNPPYIHHDEAAGMDVQVKAFEPSVALFCDSRTAMYKAIEQFARARLKPGGRLYAELHHEHPIEHENIFAEQAWEIGIIRDTGGNRRFLRGIFQP